MKRSSIVKVAGLAAICAICPGRTALGAFFALTSPNELVNPTTITFDGYADLTIANNLFQSQGVTFSRDDGQAVFISDWAALGRTTPSPPDVLATITDFVHTTSYVTHLNAQFANPLSAIGAYFGNDQGMDYAFTRLTLYGLSGEVVGSVDVAANNNTSVDQFIGIQSDVPFVQARFENFNSAGSPSTQLSVVIDNLSFVPVPEPGTLSLAALALAGLLFFRKRGKRIS